MLRRSLSSFLALTFLLPTLAPAAPRWMLKDWWTEVRYLRLWSCESSLSAVSNGRPVHRREGKSYRLDEVTKRDIGISNLLFPLYARHAPDSLGRLRLATLLGETTTDPDEIRLRREAIRELEANPRMRHDLRAYLRQLDRRFDADEAVRFAESKPSVTLNVQNELIAVGGMLATALGLGVATYLQPEKFQEYLFYAATPFMMLGSAIPHLARALVWTRDRHLEIKAAIETADELATTLEGAESPLLKDLGRVMNEYRRRNYDSPANPIVRTYLNVTGDKLFRNVLDYGFISSLTMRRVNRRLDDDREKILRLLSALSETSALTAIAEYGVATGGLTEPEILDVNGPTRIDIKEGHHPYVLADLFSSSVANDVHLSSAPGDTRATVLTGINRGGKSTVMRMIASLALMAQVGSRVPAAHMAWTPMGVATNMTVNDSVQDRASFFEAQSARVEFLLRKINDERHVLLLMDEIFTGTSPEEHRASERATLKYLLLKRPGVVSILATHDRRLTSLADERPDVASLHVGDVGEPPFQLKPGVSRTRNAVDVMRGVGLPEDFLSMVEEELKAQVKP